MTPTRLINGQPSKYTFLNNAMIMVSSMGDILTNYEFDFETPYLTPDGIKESIDNNLPVIVDGTYPGTHGHYILIVGYDDDNNFICNDPYGNFNDTYKNHDEGDHVVYSIADIWKYGAKMLSGNKMAVVTAKYKGAVLDHDITPVVDPNPNP